METNDSHVKGKGPSSILIKIMWLKNREKEGEKERKAEKGRREAGSILVLDSLLIV